jgi:hypothetical protein
MLECLAEQLRTLFDLTPIRQGIGYADVKKIKFGTGYRPS